MRRLINCPDLGGAKHLEGSTSGEQIRGFYEVPILSIRFVYLAFHPPFPLASKNVSFLTKLKFLLSFMLKLEFGMNFILLI